MAGTKEGGRLAARTNKMYHGEDFYRRIGAMGGKASSGYGFAHGKVDPHEAGQMGGQISRKGFTVIDKAPFEEGFTKKRSFWKGLRIGF